MTTLTIREEDRAEIEKLIEELKQSVRDAKRELRGETRQNETS